MAGEEGERANVSQRFKTGHQRRRGRRDEWGGKKGESGERKGY